jgi:hypothetical protein
MEGFAMGVRWARRRFRQACDDGWAKAVESLGIMVSSDRYTGLHFPGDKLDTEGVADDMSKARDEDVDLPF